MAIEKILEIRGEDWAKGYSFQNGLPYGGLFSNATSFDPFKLYGYMVPSVEPVEVGAAQISKAIRYIAPGQVSGTNFIFSWADNGSTPALYKTNVLSGVTTDESGNVTVTSSAARGIIVYGGYVVYARNTEIRSVTTALATETQILTTNVTSGEHPFTIGADKNIYFPNGNYVGKINSATGLAATTGNDAQAFAMEPGLNIRHLVNDGRYLVIIADDGSTSTSGKVNCVIAYWDYTSTTLTQRYDFQAAGLTAGFLMDDAVYVFGKDYLYVANLSTSPRTVFPFIGSGATITAYPTSPGQISQQGNSVYWGSGPRVYAYGSFAAGAKKIVYQPYTFDDSVTAFIQTGIAPFGATSGSDLFAVGFSPATSLTAGITTAQMQLPSPYKFEFARITMRSVMSTGKTATFSINCRGGGGSVTGASTFSFSNDGAKQSYIFKPSGGGATVDWFDEFSVTIESNATIEKLEIWGTRGDDQLQLL